MARIKPVICLALRAIVPLIVVGLVLGPETIGMRVDEALSVAWRALGDQLANRELDAIARQLDRERRDAERIGAARDGLSARLRSLEAFRDCVATDVGEQYPPPGADSEHVVPRLDTAIAMLRSARTRSPHPGRSTGGPPQARGRADRAAGRGRRPPDGPGAHQIRWKSIAVV